MRNNLVIVAFMAFLFFSFSSCKKAAKIDLWAPSSPAIVRVQPLTGTDSTVVTIWGRRFSTTVSNNTIEVNGKEAQIVFAADNELRFLVPKDAGSGKIELIVNGHSTTGPLFNYIKPEKRYLVSTFAGSTAGFEDGIGTAAKFTNPDGVTFDNEGNLIVTDRTNHSIRKIAPNGVVTTVAGNGHPGYADGMPGQFNFPWQCAVDKDNNIIVVAKGGARIRKIDPSGMVSTFAGNGHQGYAEGIPGEFNNPLDAAIDKDGNIFIADRNNKRIRKVTPDGEVSTFAGDGTTAVFSLPSSLVFDKHGNLFVADYGLHLIKKITPDGVVSTIAGNGTKGYSNGTPGDPTTAEIGDVFGLAIDNDGNLIIADASNAMIRMLKLGEDGKLSDGTMVTIAGTGQTGKKDGSGLSATFNNPYDVAVASDGEIYVADNSNHLIRKIVYK